MGTYAMAQGPLLVLCDDLNGKGIQKKRICVYVFCCLLTKSCLTLVTPWTVAHQAPLSLGFPRQEY